MKRNKTVILILAFLLIGALIADLGRETPDEETPESGGSETEPEPEPEPEPIRSTVSFWQLYDKWRWVEKQISGETDEAQVPNGAVACKIVVYWEGTRPISKGYGSLSIKPRKLIDAGDHNEIIYLRNEELDVNKSLLDMPGSIELIVYVEEDALYYFFTLIKANIGDCRIEVYFGF